MKCKGFEKSAVLFILKYEFLRSKEIVNSVLKSVKNLSLFMEQLYVILFLQNVDKKVINWLYDKIESFSVASFFCTQIYVENDCTLLVLKQFYFWVECFKK